MEHIRDHPGFNSYMIAYSYPTRINVILYYLRKRYKYGPSNNVRFTTTDCCFKTRVEQVYDLYVTTQQDNRAVKVDDTIADYILGYRLLANVAWSEVDYMIIIINVKDKFHWVLGVFDICKRTLIVYDSFIAAGNNNAVHQPINKFSVVIPLFLQCLDFYGKRTDINFKTTPAYIGKSISQPLEVQWLVTEVPRQKFGSLDCGVYVAVFVEYVRIGEFSITSINFNIEEHRRRFGALLWDYARRKQELGAISDSEVTGRIARKRGGPPKKQRFRIRNK
nr:uncharacterized protein LOC108943744 [Nicotiana tomentosiformis]